MCDLFISNVVLQEVTQHHDLQLELELSVVYCELSETVLLEPV